MILVLSRPFGVVVQLLGLNLWAWVANYRQIVFTFAVWAMERGERKRQEGEKGTGIGGEEWKRAPLA